MINMGGFKKRASVIFYLTDQFSTKAVKTANISVSGQSIPYVNKQDGYYVFANMQPGNYSFTVQEPNYVNVTKNVDLLGAEPAIFQLKLQHHVSSRLIDDTTRISGLVKEKGGLIINQVIKVAVISPAIYIRLMEEAQKGGTAIKPYSNEGLLLEGKEFLVLGSKNHEVIQIQKYYGEKDMCLLEGKLKNSYSSGTQLYPLWELKTNDNGEFILPLSSNCEKNVELKVLYGTQIGSEHIVLLNRKINEISITL